MDSLNAPQIMEHISQSLTYTPFDCKWIPCSAKFVVAGQTPRAKGILQVYQMNQGKLDLVSEINKEYGFKCCTFGASSFTNRELAVGDYEGYLSIFDLEKGEPSFKVKAHKSIINGIDGIGGTGNIGAAEIITAGRDGKNFIFLMKKNYYCIIFRLCKNLGSSNRQTGCKFGTIRKRKNFT